MGLGRVTEGGKNQPGAELKEGEWSSGVWRGGRGREYEEGRSHQEPQGEAGRAQGPRMGLSSPHGGGIAGDLVGIP